jgi:DNA polymerase-1
MILQVHDELIVETREANTASVFTLMRETMENALELDAPLRVDLKIGGNWEEMEAIPAE